MLQLECRGADSAADIVDSDAFCDMFTFLVTLYIMFCVAVGVSWG